MTDLERKRLAAILGMPGSALVGERDMPPGWPSSSASRMT
jgi:hypothetical protein